MGPSPATTTRCCTPCSKPPTKSRVSTPWRANASISQLTLDANEAAYRLAEERYKAGLASYLTVLNAETQVRSPAKPWWTSWPIRQWRA